MPRVRRCRFNGCHAMCVLPMHYCEQHAEHEQEYLASRQKWARSHTTAYQHKYNTRTRMRNSETSSRYNFYRSRQWSALRQRVLERDNHLCQYCLLHGLVTPGNTVDHIVAIELDKEGRAAVDNLATICRDCHRTKTRLEQELFGTGKDQQLTGRAPITTVKEWSEKIFAADREISGK